MADEGNAGLGARVAAARSERQMTHAELAERLHVKPASISMIESGEMEPTEDLRGRLKAWMASDGTPRRTSPSRVREGAETKRRTTIQR